MNRRSFMAPKPRFVIPNLLREIRDFLTGVRKNEASLEQPSSIHGYSTESVRLATLGIDGKFDELGKELQKVLCFSFLCKSVICRILQVFLGSPTEAARGPSLEDIYAAAELCPEMLRV